MEGRKLIRSSKASRRPPVNTRLFTDLNFVALVLTGKMFSCCLQKKKNYDEQQSGSVRDALTFLHSLPWDQRKTLANTCNTVSQFSTVTKNPRPG